MTTEAAGSRTRSIIVTAVAALVLGAIVHLDWHLGRPAHHRLSGDWSMHWLVGLASGVCYAIYAMRAAGTRAVSWFAMVVAAGLIIGQVVEPAFELLYDDMTIARVMPAERVRIFLAFTVALLAGGAITLFLRPQLSRRLGA